MDFLHLNHLYDYTWFQKVNVYALYLTFVTRISSFNWIKQASTDNSSTTVPYLVFFHLSTFVYLRLNADSNIRALVSVRGQYCFVLFWRVILASSFRVSWTTFTWQSSYLTICKYSIYMDFHMNMTSDKCLRYVLKVIVIWKSTGNDVCCDPTIW